MQSTMDTITSNDVVHNSETNLETSDDDDQTAALEILNNVRTLLIQAFESDHPDSFGAKLTSEYPIIAKNDLGGDLGRCEIHRHGGWQRTISGVEQAKSFSIGSLSIQLKSDQGSVLPIEVLLSTFLHELAHTITVPERIRLASIPKEYVNDFLEIKPEEWVFWSHSPVFYKNFGILLQKAEQLGIFVIPSVPNKYSVRNLRRFDSVSVSASISGLNLLGNSPMFGKGSQQHQESQLPLRLILTDAQGTKQKPVTLQVRSKELVMKEAKTRLNLRKKAKNVLTTHGESVTDDMLSIMENDTVLIVT